MELRPEQLRPEQKRALVYLERRGSRASASSVRQAVAGALSKLEAALEAVDPAQATRRPVAGGWCLLEVVDHLVESHRPAVEQLRSALAGEEPGPAIPAGLLSADATAHAWPSRLADLWQVHRDLIAALPVEEEPPEPRSIPIVMVIRAQVADGSTEVLEWVEELDWKAFAVGIKVHSLEHLSQVRRLTSA